MWIYSISFQLISIEINLTAARPSLSAQLDTDTDRSERQRQRERQRDRERPRETARDTQTHTETQRETQRDTQRERQTDRERDRQTDRQRDRQRQRDRETETETERERELLSTGYRTYITSILVPPGGKLKNFLQLSHCLQVHRYLKKPSTTNQMYNGCSDVGIKEVWVNFFLERTS